MRPLYLFPHGLLANAHGARRGALRRASGDQGDSGPALPPLLAGPEGTGVDAAPLPPAFPPPQSPPPPPPPLPSPQRACSLSRFRLVRVPLQRRSESGTTPGVTSRGGWWGWGRWSRPAGRHSMCPGGRGRRPYIARSGTGRPAQGRDQPRRPELCSQPQPSPGLR